MVATDKKFRKLSADCAYQSRLLLGLYKQLVNIRDEIEDEGDRAYFGSTNHADDFREVVDSLEDWDNERLMDGAKLPDLYASLRTLRAALYWIDQEAPATEPYNGPTVGFQPSHDPEEDDGNGVVCEAYDEGVARGLWIAANMARPALRDSVSDPEGQDAEERLGAQASQSGSRSEIAQGQQP